VVVDGKEGVELGGTRSIFVEGEEKPYDIAARSLVFSPDSKRLAYVAVAYSRKLRLIHSHRRSLVIVDGEEGRPYDTLLVPAGGGGIVFDSPDQLRYMAQKGNGFYLVEERLAYPP